jgi:hypothetical protein
MKQRTGVIGPLCTLLVVLAAAGCIGIGEHELRATFEPGIRATASHEVAPTLTAAAESRVTLETFHERYVIALGEREGWALGQTDDPSQGCARFTLYPLENSQVALKTCLGRYVIAPRADQDRTDWRLSQAPELDECGQFVLHNVGHDEFALETCAGLFLTAGDGGWPDELAWAIVAETDAIGGWERFRLDRPYAPLSSTITRFDSCGEPAKRARGIQPLDSPDAGNTLHLAYPQESGHGCVARIEYDIVEWSALWIDLLHADLRPYRQLSFDIRADAPLPGQIKIELKRASGAESSILYVSGITADWQTRRVKLRDFAPTGYMLPLSTLVEMEELLFTVAAERSGKTGTVYLDNIALE